MIPDCKRRLKAAYDDLTKLVVSEVLSELIGITFCIQTKVTERKHVL